MFNLKNLEKLFQFQMNEMSFFIPSNFQNIVRKGLNNGDYFLKICGAGGGGFILGFTNDWNKTLDELHQFDLEIIYRY